MGLTEKANKKEVKVCDLSYLEIFVLNLVHFSKVTFSFMNLSHHLFHQKPLKHSSFKREQSPDIKHLTGSSPTEVVDSYEENSNMVINIEHEIDNSEK